VTAHGDETEALPLTGCLVVDATRMLPGAVAARSLLDQGARLIKIEAPRGGDLMRGAGPARGGMAVGFCHYFRGAESLPLDLRKVEDRRVLERLVARADVFVESFRPGTLAGWGLGADALRQRNAGLVTCSIPGYPADSQDSRAVVGHDLNFTGATGLLSLLPGALGDPANIPAVQVADVTAGLLAAQGIVAALFRRTRTGRGGHIEQPLAAGPLPFMGWAMADTAAAGANHSGVSQTMLAGKVPCYRNYRCQDGRLITVGCLEPKFWVVLTQRLGVPELATAGLDVGERGRLAAAKVAEVFAQKSCGAWLEGLADAQLPVGPVLGVQEALEQAPSGALAALFEDTPMPDGTTLRGPGPAVPSVSRTPQRPAPRLGEHADTLRREFNLDDHD